MTEHISDGLDYHQQLMTEAYEGHTKSLAKGETWRHRDMVANLDPLHLTAVLLGNLEYQVCNGGWGQWHDNGYSRESKKLLKILEEMKGECPHAPAIHAMVSESADNIKEAEGLCEEDFEDCCNDCEEEDCDGCDEGGSWERYEEAQNDLLGMDALSDRYYEDNAKWLVQVEFYLRRKGGLEIPEELLEEHKEDLEFGRPVEPKPPRKPSVQLIGQDGNAFLIMGKVMSALRKAGFPKEELDRYQSEATSGDYSHLLAVTSDFVNIQ